MGSPHDPPQHLWFLVWTPWALTHLQDPFLTTHLHVPGGDNLMWNPLMPVAGLALWPITATARPVVAYDVLATGGIVLTRLAARAALLHITGSGLGALIAGLFIAVSPFVVAQAHGHVDLVLIVSPPEGRRERRRGVSLRSATL